MMTDRDRLTLKDLLRELIKLQDSITHNNEKGLPVSKMIRDRDFVKTKIIAFCDARIE